MWLLKYSYYKALYVYGQYPQQHKKISQEYWLSLRHLLFTCDLPFRGFAVIYCSEFKRKHEHTTPTFLKIFKTLGSKADIFTRENEIATPKEYLTILNPR